MLTVSRRGPTAPGSRSHQRGNSAAGLVGAAGHRTPGSLAATQAWPPVSDAVHHAAAGRRPVQAGPGATPCRGCARWLAASRPRTALFLKGGAELGNLMPERDGASDICSCNTSVGIPSPEWYPCHIHTEVAPDGERAHIDLIWGFEPLRPPWAP